MCYTIYYWKDMGLLSDPIEQLVGRVDGEMFTGICPVRPANWIWNSWIGRSFFCLGGGTLTPLLPKEVAWCLFQISGATRNIFQMRHVLYMQQSQASNDIAVTWTPPFLFNWAAPPSCCLIFFVAGTSLQPFFCNYGTISYFGSCPVVEGYTMIILWFTLPETNSSHLKMDAWNTIVSGANRSFWGG